MFVAILLLMKNGNHDERIKNNAIAVVG